MFQFTISVGNFIVKLCYVLGLVAIVLCAAFFTQDYGALFGIAILSLGTLLVVLGFYLLFIFIDIRQQLVNLNAKLDKTENKENL